MASFGKKIRGIRYHLGMSQEEIGTLLNTSKQNISRYEKEQNSPRIDTVDAFASKLGIPITFLINDDFSVQETINALENRSLIYKKYELSSSTIARTIQTMQRLNHEGQSIVAKTADGLDKSGQYRAEKDIEVKDVKEVYTVGSAAAGIGVYNDGYYDAPPKLVKSEEVPKHDKAINVQGTSMEPTIMDGSIAYLANDFEIQNGRIYSVTICDVSYVKRSFIDGDSLILRSDNPEVKDLVFTGSDLETLKIEGRVVGWTT